MRALFRILLLLLVLAIGAIVADRKGLIDLPLEKVPGLAGLLDPKTTDTATASGASTSEKSKASAANSSEVDNDAFATRYPIPDFKPIEVLLSNWTKVPPSAFPREVLLKKEVDREIKAADGKVIGSSKVAPGTSIQALGMEGSQVILALDAQTAARSLVPIDHTDLKDSLTRQYESWKLKIEKRVLAQRDAARERSIKASSKGGDASGQDVDLIVQEPAVASIPSNDPRFAPLITSIKNDGYKELTFNSVTGWQWVGPQNIDGVDYEVGIVQFNGETIFGNIPSEAMGLVRNGKVDKWIYTGSLEPVQ